MANQGKKSQAKISLLSLILAVLSFKACECTSPYAFNTFVQTNLISICEPQFSKWVFDPAFTSEQSQFLEYEKRFQAHCAKNVPWKSYHLAGNLQQPSSCNSLTICNSTFCLTYPKEAMKFIFTLPKPCAREEARKRFDNTLRGLTSNQKLFKTNSVFNFYDLKSMSSNIYREFQLSSVKKQMQFHSTFAENVDDYLSKNCNSENSGELFYEGAGSLPDDCDRLRFCNKTSCSVISLTGNAYAYLFRRHEESSMISLELPGNCEVIRTISRTTRGVLKNNEDEGITKLMEKKSLGLLRFNLPGGYLYCGPGTNVEEMDDLGGPVDELDQICRSHDVDYLIGVPPQEADEKLLKSLWDIKSPFLPLFIAVFEAKRYFENVYGTEYTSSLYYFPEKQKSLLFSLADTSSYEGLYPFSPEYKPGLELETKWKTILFNMWQGYCYANDMPAFTQLVREKQNLKQYLGQMQPGTSSQTSSSESAERTGPPEDSYEHVNLPTANVVDVYPAIPLRYGQCRVVISEIATKSGKAPNFVELQRLCPPKVHQLSTLSLKGYHLLIIRIGDPSEIIVNLNLDTHNLKIKVETNPASRRPKSNMYFVFGTANTNPDLDLENIEHFVTPQDGIKGIPAQDDLTYAIVLMYFPGKPIHDAAISDFAMQHREEFYVPKVVTDVQRSYIDKYVQDIIIYGAPCSVDICNEYLRLIPSTSNVLEPVGRQYIPIPYVKQNVREPFLSMNRCTPNDLPMQNSAFAEDVATPGKINNCPSEPPNGLFNFRGTLLQSSAQKVIVNVHHHFQEVFAGRRVIEGSPLDMSSSACSLGKNVITRILASWRAGTIVTPGKKRKIIPHKQAQIDSFYSDMIKRIIQDYYKKNYAPFVADIFSTFKEDVLVQERVRKENGEQFIPFRCSEKTFRRILRRLGFKFGRMQTRDVLLMRPQIVMWRDKYLNILKKNRKSDNPKKIIYLDETWIDPHARTTKAWVPIRCTNYRERAKYTYQKHKVSRGPRIIILNAGGEDGFVEGALEIFPVHKKDNTGDYHDNINSEAYIKWFKKLLQILKATGEKYMIVQDNAPYHGASDAPTVRSTTKFMYEWLDDNLPLIDRRALLPIDRYRRSELWDMVKEQKAKNNFFIVDRLANLDGHEVVRLPPYNCDLSPIELAWNDVKFQVKRENLHQNVNAIIETAKRIMLNYPKEKWQAFVRKTMELEESYWKADGCFETFYSKNSEVIVPINDDDDDDDNDDDDECLAGPEVAYSTVHDDDSTQDDDDELLDI